MLYKLFKTPNICAVLAVLLSQPFSVSVKLFQYGDYHTLQFLNLRCLTMHVSSLDTIIGLKDKRPCFYLSMEFPFFHGKISRKACEELLCKKGKNGSYLIRESESVAGALCLCVFFEGVIYTYRIFREYEGYYKIQTSEGVPEKVFRTLKDLIYNYEKPNQGLVTKLRYPVKKTSSSQRSQKFKLGNDDIYDEIDESDYVDVLC